MVTSHSTKEFYVYVFRNPLKKYERFYVGKGTGNRWMCHFKESKSSNPSRHYNPFKDKTIEEIQAADMEPVIEKMWHGWDEKYALGLEVALIAMWKRRCDGGTLTNITAGGEGASGHIVSAETRAKISVTGKGRKLSKEHLQKLLTANTGHVVSEETRLESPSSGRTHNYLYHYPYGEQEPGGEATVGANPLGATAGR
jgi:hypothetical protein